MKTGDPAFAGSSSNWGVRGRGRRAAEGLQGREPGAERPDRVTVHADGLLGRGRQVLREEPRAAERLHQRAVMGWCQVAVAQKDQQALMALAEAVPGHQGSVRRRAAHPGGAHGKGQGGDRAGAGPGRRVRGAIPDGTWRDEADFLMAKLLETDSQFRDIARARDLYRSILANDPESASRQRRGSGCPTSTGTSSRCGRRAGAAWQSSATSSRHVAPALNALYCMARARLCYTVSPCAIFLAA